MRIFAILIIFSCLLIEACKCNKEQPESRPVNSIDQSFFQNWTGQKWVFYRDSLYGAITLATITKTNTTDTIVLGDIQSGVPIEGTSSSSCYPFYFKTIVRPLNYLTVAGKTPDTYYIKPTQLYGGSEVPTFSVVIARNTYFRIDTLTNKPILLTINGISYDSVYVLKPNYPMNLGRDVFPDSVYYQRKAGLLRYSYRSFDGGFVRWNRQ